MTVEVMRSRLSVITGETDDAVLLTYLDMARERVLARCYPFGCPEGTEVPTRYHSKELEIAVYLLNKRGAEGETAHNENGINRFYESASVPDSMLKDIIPFASPFSLGGG